MNYTNDLDQLTGSTTTWRPPDKVLCEQMIVTFMKAWAKKKWYQPKNGLLNEAKHWAKELEKYYKL